VKGRLPVLLAALAIAASVVGLGGGLAATRAERAEAYARDRAAQRRAAAATRTTPATAPAPVDAQASGCVTGVDTFAVALGRSLAPLPGGEARSRRVAALRQLSAEAARAERAAELAGVAPTLPKRMGLAGGQPVVAERRACGGKGYAELGRSRL
jgi:hypothetical protein